MSKIREIIRQKGTDVLTMPASAPVVEAAISMTKNQVGCVVIVNDQDQMIGIFTERDILRRVVAQRLDPAQTPVSQVMSSKLICCEMDTSIDEARTAMKERRIRHLPVIDEQKNLLGIVSIGDLNAYRLTGQEIHINMLQEYLFQRT